MPVRPAPIVVDQNEFGQYDSSFPIVVKSPTFSADNDCLVAFRLMVLGPAFSICRNPTSRFKSLASTEVASWVVAPQGCGPDDTGWPRTSSGWRELAD